MAADRVKFLCWRRPCKPALPPSDEETGRLSSVDAPQLQDIITYKTATHVTVCVCVCVCVTVCVCVCACTYSWSTTEYPLVGPFGFPAAGRLGFRGAFSPNSAIFSEHAGCSLKPRKKCVCLLSLILEVLSLRAFLRFSTHSCSLAMGTAKLSCSKNSVRVSYN